jgi:N-acetylglucosamine kinase-like BadF-type ATPase
MTQYFIGIDGGASKTLGVMIDERSTLLAGAKGGPSSIIGAPSQTARKVLRGIKRQLCAAAGVAPTTVAGIALGLNGIDFPDEFPMQHVALSAALEVSPARLLLVNDGIVALWGASPAPVLAIVQHGSGITCASRTAYGREQLFDHLNAGRLFDMREALATLIVRMIDGREKPTPLKGAALRYYDHADETTFAAALFRRRIPDQRFRTAISVLFAAWQAGDPAAARLVKLAVEDYLRTARALIARTGNEQCEIAFGGGVINNAPPEFFALLADGVQSTYPEVTVLRPQLPPAYGAALLIAFHHGYDPATLFARLHKQVEGRG